MIFRTMLALISCGVISLRTFATHSTEFLPSPPAGKEWKLVWQDEFEGAKLDESKWNRLGDSKRRDGFWIKDDAFLNGKGQLILRTRKDGERFTCGAVNTQGKFEHAFGYYVARCKIPAQPGHWPAFWLMAKSVSQVGDDGRDGTEIDIVEIPWRDGRLTSNLHWDGYGKSHKSAGTKFTVPAVTNGFYTFSLFWQPAEYVFYVDGKEVWRSAAGGVSQVAEYIKLTEEIGKWGGGIRNAQLPDEFEVDYVRVYDLVKAGPAGQGSAQKIRVQPREIDDLFANPGMGWQTFHRFADEDKNLQPWVWWTLPTEHRQFNWQTLVVIPAVGILSAGSN